MNRRAVNDLIGHIQLVCLPLIHAIIQIIGIASTCNDLHHCKAQQGNNIEEQGCTLPPRPYEPSNDLMVLNNMVPADSYGKPDTQSVQSSLRCLTSANNNCQLKLLPSRIMCINNMYAWQVNRVTTIGYHIVAARPATSHPKAVLRFRFGHQVALHGSMECSSAVPVNADLSSGSARY